jgi:hypothetical protein
MLPANTTPAETLQISPESLEIANSYLQLQDISKVADNLDVPKDMVTSVLSRREVKAYIDNVFLNLGFNNRFTLRAAMDAVIRKKFEELEDSGTGSAKDIADLLALSHKMTMDELDRQIQLEKVKAANIKTQLNVQVNNPSANKYESLMAELLRMENNRNV